MNVFIKDGLPSALNSLPRIYRFHSVSACNMCAEPAVSAQVLGMRLDKSQGKSPKSKAGIAVSVCRCRKCALHFAQPLPVPNAISDHYGTPPEEYWKQAYFSHDPKYFAKQISDAKRLLPFYPGAKALDIGLGIGKAALAMHHAGFDVWGIEPSEPFHRKALEFTKLPADRLTNVSIESADFPSGMFRFITFGAVLEHLYDPADSIERSLKWLAPRGVIQIEVPSSDHLMSKLLNAYFRLRGTTFVTNLSPMHQPFHLYEFTPRSFEAHGKRAGYDIVHQYYDVASIRHVPSFLKPVLHSWMAARNTGAQLTVWLRKRA